MSDRPRSVWYAFFALGLLLVGVGKPSLQAADTATEKPLNVLFLVSDDLRPELGCYGNTVIQSPHIDSLAKRGIVFERAYCQQAVCSPSRSSVMTGVRPDTNKVWNLTTHFRKAIPDVITLPQWFKEHGYVTRGLGKIYHGDLQDPPSWSAREPSASTKAGQPAGREFHTLVNRNETPETPIPLTKTNRGQAFRIANDPPNSGGESELADEAIESLQEFATASQPFFLAVGFRKPHLPFVCPKAYWDLYDPQKIPRATNRFLPRDAPDYALVERNEMWNYSGVPDTNDLPEEYARQLKHGYYACVSYMDAQLGRVLDELDRLELTDNTIVILWGDHGWKLGEHNRWCKHSNVEDDARAPLVISVPGMKHAGRSTKALVEFVDIYPTLVDLANLPLPEHLEGTSFRPVLDRPEETWKTAAFSQYPRTVNGRRLMGYSMRTDRYRFTRWVHIDDHTKVDAEELYDHQTDPQENQNVAGQAGYSELCETLRKQWLAGWQGAVPQTAAHP
ncbi:sulfatase [Aporhodopirellula aestuarii]|uniref:Sulfatase n=1 Tax=Aporhodopirellula aestuarii TaxID=2950107 RepID=A0ABT0U906_9BACT|nr:sulfatase [Aporhodopirellula aestuarii]MCM2373452.1 sulfatase [Aporhodopirellula aestuarii]